MAGWQKDLPEILSHGKFGEPSEQEIELELLKRKAALEEGSY